jgi:hypothetical protein
MMMNLNKKSAKRYKQLSLNAYFKIIEVWINDHINSNTMIVAITKIQNTMKFFEVFVIKCAG